MSGQGTVKGRVVGGGKVKELREDSVRTVIDLHAGYRNH